MISVFKMARPVRIIGVADLHGHVDQLSRLKELNADLIAFCGDLHNSGTLQEARPVAQSLANLGPPVFIIPGNMDPKGFVLDLWQELGLIVLHGKSCQLEDTGFIGLGGMAIHNPMRISDLTRFYLPEEVYKSLANAYMEISDLPRKVVLSHQPPRGARDTVHSGVAVGSLSLRRFVDDFRPKLLICGHIHEDKGRTELGKTTVVNVGEMRRGHAALIEMDEKVKVEWI